MGYGRCSYEEVIALVGLGLSDSRISAITGVGRGTVRRWRVTGRPPLSVEHDQLEAEWAVTDAPTYCYLLGAYLGDGTLCTGKGKSLQIVNDRRYPCITHEICEAMAATFPGRRARVHPSFAGQSDVICISHPAVVKAFPQHGPGRKHLRLILLSDWQLALTHVHPAALIRGLIHSDGCRVVNRFRTKLPSGRVAEYSYIRYFFTNHSEDIRRIFRNHCELLGLRVTQSNHRISPSRIEIALRCWRR